MDHNENKRIDKTRPSLEPPEQKEQQQQRQKINVVPLKTPENNSTNLNTYKKAESNSKNK